METRQITEIRVWKLVLNPMRGNTETSTLVAISADKDRLLSWYNEQLAETPYTEEGSPSFETHGSSHKWHKSFKKGSSLEWYNPFSDFSLEHYGQGISDDWVTQEVYDNANYLKV